MKKENKTPTVNSVNLKRNRLLIINNHKFSRRLEKVNEESFRVVSLERATEIVRGYTEGYIKQAFFKDSEGKVHQL